MKQCVTCGKPFSSNYNRQMNCSKECSEKHKLKYITQYGKEHKEAINKKRNEKHIPKRGGIVVCEVCGIEFYTSHKNTKVCSDVCREEKHKLYQRERSDK